MFIGKTIEIVPGDANDELLIGFYNQALIGYPLDENGEVDESQEPVNMNRFVIGLLFFNINFYYR